MKTSILFLLLSFGFGNQLLAQGFYAKLGGGYALPMGSQNWKDLLLYPVSNSFSIKKQVVKYHSGDAVQRQSILVEYAPLAYSPPVIFVETPPFERRREDYFDDDQYGLLQASILRGIARQIEGAEHGKA
jgi:hypothetical protein